MCKYSCTFRGFAEAEIHCLQRRPHLQAKGHVTLKRSENVCDSLRGKRGKCCGERFSRPHLLLKDKQQIVSVVCEVDCDPHRAHGAV